MAVDKNKIVAEATKLVQKGAHDKAIAAYQKILAEDPKDSRVLLKVAELHQKKGDDKAAAEAFKKVADTYAEQGFFLKAVAVYKQIVKLDPDDVRVNERLAGLYQQLGLLSDAMSQYQLMASAHERAGDAGRLTDVLKRMVELDPENIASSVKLGELCARGGDTAGALDHFRRAAEHLKRHNRADEYVKIAERLAALLPEDLSLTRELANIYLQKGDTKRALAKLQLCFKADPKDVETLNLLAQAFRDLGQTSKTVSVYKELAHVHAESGRAAEARATWRRVQEVAPDDPELAEALGGGPPAPAAAPPPARAPATGPPPGAAAPPPPQAPAGAEAVTKLLTETDVYVKYGLHDKALDHLRKVLAAVPEQAEALERMREIHAAAGRPGEAADAAARAARARVAEGRLDLAREALARLRQLAPSHAAIGELVSAVGVTEEVSLGVSEEISLSGASVEDASEVDEDILAPAPVREDEDALALAAAGQGDEEIVDDEPVGPARGGRGEEGIALDVEEPRRPAPAPPRAGPPPRAGTPPRRPRPEREPDLSDEIEEADFFLQQGLVDEAREALRNLLSLYPGHAVVRARLADLDRRAARSEAPRAGRERPAAPAGPRASPSLVAPGEPDESFDIARELADELDEAPAGPSAADDDFQYSVEDVFSQFKKGVEQTVRKEDSATHYDLGIAYHEMGLLDDAIHEFETALGGNDRKKEVDALSMIGLCRMAKGETQKAVAAWRRALRSEHLSRDAAKAIQYELGVAYEAQGDREAALWYLHRTAQADAGFRDVRARLAALGGGPGRPPPDAEAAARPAVRAAPNGPARPAAAPAAARSAGAGSKKNIGYL
jgi:tetratricopeptide (TPR) repeat protein